MSSSVRVTYTDTFGGKANYSWVKTTTFDAFKLSDRTVMRRARDLMGLQGTRGRWTEFGHGWSYRPYRSNTILFVTYII